MLLRPVEAEFAPRAQVFPGGRIDEADADPAWRGLVHLDADPTLEAASAEPGQPDALAFAVGAIREVFEETTLLLGVDAAEHPGGEWAEAARGRVHGDEETFLSLVRGAGLEIRPASFAYFARWITPEGMPRRYDTRFFAAPMPYGQEAVAAPGEIQSLEWISPTAALARADTNDAYTLPPTRAVLTKLAAYADVADAFARIHHDADVAPILPRVVSLPASGGPDAGIKVLLPGEPGYDQ